jgi:hypothetical protein
MRIAQSASGGLGNVDIFYLSPEGTTAGSPALEGWETRHTGTLSPVRTDEKNIVLEKCAISGFDKISFACGDFRLTDAA